MVNLTICLPGIKLPYIENLRIKSLTCFKQQTNIIHNCCASALCKFLPAVISHFSKWNIYKTVTVLS